MYSTLNQMLVEERVRGGTGDSPGRNTPLMIEFSVNPEMEDVVVSTPRESFLLIDNSKGRQELRTGLFEAPLEDENEIHAELAWFLFEKGTEEGWGNTAEWDGFDDDRMSQITAYFDSYNLDLYHVFTGLSGLMKMYEGGFFEFEEGERPDMDDLTEEDLMSFVEEKMRIGELEVPGQDDPVSVFFNPFLGRLSLFAVKPPFFGQLIRIQDRAGVAIHNPFRGSLGVLTPSMIESEDDDSG